MNPEEFSDLEKDLDLNMFMEKTEEPSIQNEEEETCQPIQIKKSCDCKNQHKNKICKCPPKELQAIIQMEKTTAIENAKTSCSKCNEKKALIKFRNDPCCNECFIVMMEHKFKYTLRNLLKMNRDDHILMSFSGGPNSIALLKMMSETLFNPGAKKMFFTAQVVHIDESIVYEGELGDKCEEEIKKVKEFCALMKFDLEILRIQDVLSLRNSKGFLPELPESINADLLKNKDEVEQFKVFVNNLSANGYSREGMLYIFKLALILAYAKSKKIKKVALADTGQVMAGKILSEIIQGRGVEIQNMIKFLDEKFEQEEILLGRPLRDFLKKEILLYNHIYKLGDFTIMRENISSNNKGLPGNGNFNILIENLLDRLQEQNNATVHTVLNTLDKVKTKYDYFKDNKYCPICFNQRDKLFNILEIGTLKYLNSNKNETNIPLEYLPDKSLDEIDYLTKLLCFGCRRIVENSQHPEIFFKFLPSFMRNNLEKMDVDLKNNEKNKSSEFFLTEKEKY